jgi:hypothetical protein
MGGDPRISNDDLRDLFEYLDRANMAGYECDHTFALTEEFLRYRDIAAEQVIKWLAENGAGCDCEVMMNTASQWAEIVGYQSPDVND